MPIVVIIIAYIILIAVPTVYICKHAMETVRIHNDAKLNLGSKIPLHKDKGARLAHKGLCAFFRNNYGKALLYFEKAMEHSYVSQNNAFCLDWMIKCYDAQEKYDEALQCCIKAVNYAPSNIRTLFNIADRYSRAGRFDKAEYYYNTILKYDKDNVAAIFMLGAIHMGGERYEEANNQLSRVLEIDERFTSAAAELSVLSAIRDDQNQAEIYYNQVKDNNFRDLDRLEKRLTSIKTIRDLCNDS
ncbi:MAG: tetratricopeptide repeat protein [Oscillospiraceae bacterium]|nr:tetratricopeptide repeat protein [Oscillospiraceae bacterium]